MNVDLYRKTLRAAGVSEATIESELAELLHVSACIDVNKCPKCGAGLVQRVDPRQASLTPTNGGVWHNVRCARNSDWGEQRASGQCDFFCDRLVYS